MTITEFDELDPTTFHLVPQGASGFPALMAKARGTVGEVLDETGDLTKARWAGFCGEDECPCCKQRFGPMFETLLEKSKLKSKQRNALPDSAFALPKTREYPIHDENHGRAALSMLHNASPADQKKIKAAVHRRYPDIGQGDDVKTKKEGTPQASHEQHAIPSPSGSEHQTNENHPQMGAVHMDVMPDGSVVVKPNFSGAPAPAADQEGHGFTAPDKALPTGEAGSQTRANARKAGEGDGRGTPAPDGESDDAKAERMAREQTEENTRKAHEALLKLGEMTPEELTALTGLSKETPGDAEWEKEDAELAEEAGQLIARLESREKAEGSHVGKTRALTTDAEGTIRRLAQKAQGLLDTTTTKEIEDMDSDELVKMLDERDAARRTAKKEAKKAAKQKAAKAKSKMKMKSKSKKPMTDEEMAEKAAADPVWAAKQKAKADVKAAKAAQTTSLPPEVQKQLDEQGELLKRIAAQPQPHPLLNGNGLPGAVTRGAGATGSPLVIKERAPGESWSVDSVHERLREEGVLKA